MNPLGREFNHNGHSPRRPGDDRGVESSGEMEAEARDNGQGDKDPGERWFRREKSRAEICTLFHLEEDLKSTMLFEHGGTQRASELWLTHILLGHLSREKTTLGKAVEVFSKLQRRDIMHSMVKLHNLVDLAKPPWKSMADIHSVHRPREEAMDLDEALENQDEEAMESLTSSGEENLGLG